MLLYMIGSISVSIFLAGQQLSCRQTSLMISFSSSTRMDFWRRRWQHSSIINSTIHSLQIALLRGNVHLVAMQMLMGTNMIFATSFLTPLSSKILDVKLMVQDQLQGILNISFWNWTSYNQKSSCSSNNLQQMVCGPTMAKKSPLPGWRRVWNHEASPGTWNGELLLLYQAMKTR